MAAKFSAGEPPDLFYVDSSVAQDWIDQGVLQDARRDGRRTRLRHEPVLPGLPRCVQGPRRQDYGFPKDGNTLAMAYNTDLLDAAGIEPPTTWEELKTAAETLTTGDRNRPSASTTASTGRSRSSTRTAARSSARTRPRTPSTRRRPRSAPDVPRLLQERPGRPCGRPRRRLVRQGPRTGASGDHLRGRLARPVHEAELPRRDYAWAEMPQGTEKATLGFTVSYSIGVDSAEQGRRVGAAHRTSPVPTA